MRIKEKKMRMKEKKKAITVRFIWFIPDLISLGNRWTFKWSWWNGWCWPTETIKKKLIYSFSLN